MKNYIFIFFICFTQLFIYAQDDGMNERIISTYENDVEVARVSLTFIAGFKTTGHNNFLAYIDPNLPLNGGTPVTDGEFNLNYIRVFEPIRNNFSESIPVHNQVDYENDWKESITYYDGLGREIQQTMVKASAYGNDVIIPVLYDDVGRRKKEYLPYAIAQDANSDGPGGYRTSPETEVVTFHNCYYEGTDGNYPFYDKVFDDSPLNRIVGQSSPGYDWSFDESHTRDNEYKTNETNSEVYQFRVSENNQLMKVGCYPANSLFKLINTDEDGHVSIEYKDLQNRVVKKIIKTGTEDLITQYVYDDFGHLRYVLPPETYSQLPSGTTPQTFDLSIGWVKQLCFYYQYDNRNRIIIKKLPGIDEIYMVYNNNDQLVLTQDGILRQSNEWLFNKYDMFNRAIISGIYHHSTTLSQDEMQTEVNSSSCTLFETYIIGTGYSNTAFPVLTGFDEIMTIAYYDDYQALELELVSSDYDFLSTDLPFYFLDNNTYSSETKGLTTITRTKVLLHDGLLVSDDWLTTVIYYDKYKNAVQTITDNHLGGQTVLSSQINFTGEVEETRETIDVGWETNTICQRFLYDQVGRILETEHKINNQDWIVLSNQEYAEIGQLSQKYLSGNQSSFMQDIRYKYNIRGWLTDMNDISNPGEDLFTMKLDYNNMSSGALYNGNIGRISWQSNHFETLKQYDFSYDGCNRILSCTFKDADKYTTQYSYNKNGNIKTLSRNGEIGGTDTYDLIDNLSYGYNGNQLKYINDATGTNCQENGFSDNGSYLTAEEYVYDQNGNMTKDLNKQIDNIDYNILNLPKHISISAGAFKAIDYIYSASGDKLQKSTSVNSERDDPIDYLGSIVYLNNIADYILTPEGRAVSDGNGGFSYEFFIKDHLGNTRVSFDQNGKVLQDNSYYPYGMDMGESLTYIGNSYSENKYKYNGKELQDDFDLDWYDYGERFNDPAIARFITIDPLSEKYPDISPYTYVGNNPVNAIDPDGRYILFIGGLRFWHGARDQARHVYNGLGGKTGIYKKDVFEYWSKGENTFGRKDIDIAAYFIDKYDDEKVGFTSGSSFWNSQASDRRLDGMAKAVLFHEMVQNEDIVLDAGETIKVISHSQGGAHAAGFIEQLQSYTDADGNPLYNIEVAEYITPHQPTDIDHPSGVLGIQYSHENDMISSRNYLPNGGTKFGKINGIDDSNFYYGTIMGGKGQPRANIFTRGGHNVYDNDEFILRSVDDTSDPFIRYREKGD